MERRVVVIPWSVPIPVGHRVDVIILARNIGLFGSKLEPQDRQPIVFDQTTGIWHGYEWQFAMDAHPTDYVYVPRPREDTQVVERYSGVVAACVIVSGEASGSSRILSTSLHIDVQ